jgi:hypothetical protein
MTPNQQDLQYNIEPSTAIVEVANGVLIRAQQRGTVQIRLTDINDSRRTCDILVHDVLWIPGLSRRLLSVDQWMAAGGAIHFNADYTTICVVDSDTNKTHSFDLPKPFPAQFSSGSEGNAYHVNTRSTQPLPKRAIPSDLLHHRLGHQTISNTIIVGSRNDVWLDTTLRLESDNYCESFKS